MTLAIFIFGIVAVLIGAVFFWLNVNSPVQTVIPAIALPVAVIAICVSLGAWLL